MSDIFKIPDILKGQDFKEIMSRMLSNIPDDIGKEENGWVCDLLAPVAIEKSKLIEFTLVEAIKNLFPMWSNCLLDEHADLRGLVRKKAGYARVKVTFEGLEGTVIKEGTRVSTESIDKQPGVIFSTVSEGIIKKDEKDNVSKAVIEAVSLNSGSIGNVSKGTIKLIVTPVKGVTKVKNTINAEGGFEEENDEELRKRIVEYDRNMRISFIGSPMDYKRWAMSVDGVLDAKVLSAKEYDKNGDGNGTVVIYIRCMNDNELTINNIKQKVYDYIMRPDSPFERLAPINAKLKVFVSEKKRICVKAKIKPENFDIAGTSQEITKEEIDKYINSITSEFIKDILLYIDKESSQREIKIADIGSILINIPGVSDYSNLEIGILDENNVPVLGNKNIIIDENEIPFFDISQKESVMFEI